MGGAVKLARKDLRLGVLDRPGDVELRPINADLVTAVVEDQWFDDEQANRRMGFGLGVDGRVLAYEAFKMVVSGEVVTATGIFRRGEPVGFVAWVPKSHDGRRVAVHMHLAPNAQGYGVGPSAMSQWLDIAYADGIYRVEAEVLAINRPVIRNLTHFGFHRESRLTSAWWMGDNTYDLIMFRMLRKDWRK